MGKWNFDLEAGEGKKQAKLKFCVGCASCYTWYDFWNPSPIKYVNLIFNSEARAEFSLPSLIYILLPFKGKDTGFGRREQTSTT